MMKYSIKFKIEVVKYYKKTNVDMILLQSFNVEDACKIKLYMV